MSIKLMENTKIGTFRVYNERVFKRNYKHYRMVNPDELTNAMLKSAGMEPRPELDAAPVKQAAPIPNIPVTPLAETPEVKVEGFLERPDTSEWDESTLREYALDNDIPTHPAAKTAGLQAAITRYFDELAAVGAEGNRSEGNS